MMNTENVQRLRNYYAALPGLRGWSYNDCAAGVLNQMKITTSIGDWAVADALGIDGDKVFALVAGPRTITWKDLDEVQRRDRVVAMFDGLLKTGEVDWGDRI